MPANKKAASAASNGMNGDLNIIYYHNVLNFLLAQDRKSVV